MEKVEKIKYDKYDAGKSFLLALFSPYIVLILVMAVFKFFAFVLKDNAIMDGVVYDVFSSLASQIGFICLFFIYNKMSKINSKKALNIQTINIKTVLILILLAVVMIFGFNYFLNIFDYIFDFIGYKQPADLTLPINNVWWYLLDIVVLAILPAIAEELIFRGMIFNGLKDYGLKKAVIGSALLFSLMHTSPLQTVYPFIFGILLALVYVVTKNILVPIILHFINNFIVVTTQFIANFYPASEKTLGFLYVILIGISMAIVACVAIFYILKLLKAVNKNKDNKEEEVVSNKNSKLNYPMWIGVTIGCLLWITVFVSYMI